MKNNHFFIGKLEKKSTLKLSQNKKNLNDITAAPFSVSFSKLPAAKKTQLKWAAVASLRFFLFRDDFSSLDFGGTFS